MTQHSKYYYSSPGKLLITGEYLILEGAEGLALPLKYGQDMTVVKTDDEKISRLFWQANAPEGSWFKGTFSIPLLKIETASDDKFANRLVDILQAVRQLNPGFLSNGSFRVKTALDFNPEFGFGSSSTLMANLARWAGVDAFELQKLTFKGSGYDVAVALEAKPIIYKLEQGKPVYNTAGFHPSFAEHLYFVYLGKKRRSLDAIQQFRKNARFTSFDVDAVTTITREMVQCNSLIQFERLLKEHETILSSILKTPPVQQQLFAGYSDGIAKSLGAWGGDFVLITSSDNSDTFNKKMRQLGFEVVFAYDEVVVF